ncbi:hypothetical protein J2TS6_36040 [Paenibacillus albilobatus]|uniref:WYL domain-containing protein n=1 Tax=Paenibacillus albilobatus TaxID=2716884 RepID=A0A919XLM5_9BACL|nr:hypothetical protein J2TS6_36040 [Paenibacillus albilobatus]
MPYAFAMASRWEVTPTYSRKERTRSCSVWILGPDAVILEPPEAREWITRRLEAMHRQYAELTPESR